VVSLADCMHWGFSGVMLRGSVARAPTYSPLASQYASLLPGLEKPSAPTRQSMNANAYLKVDKATFFEFVASQAEGRFEYEEGRIVQQMTGGTFAHMRIAQRFVSILERQLDPDAWAVTSHGRGVETAKTVRYPDVVVEALGAGLKGLSTDKPRIIVEVLSPSTQALDLNTKPPEYMSLASLEAYIVASQDLPLCWVWLRGLDRQFGELPEELAGRESMIHVSPLGVNIKLGEIYRGISPEAGGKAP
jgi:Uma2 family endonuclease